MRGPPLFFDDQMSNFANRMQECPRIKPVEVHVSPRISRRANNERLLSLLRPQVRSVARKSDILRWYNPSGGVDPIKVAAMVVKYRPKYVVFDWDQTLTQFDGVDPTMPPRYAAEMLMGGWPRMRGMQEMFRTLHEHNVPYYVLTKNPAAETNPAFFRRVLRYAGGTNPEWIRYSGGTSKLRFLRNKGMCRG